MAGAAALSFLDFGEESGALKARLADLDGPLDGLIARFTKLSNIEQVNQIEKTSKDLEALKAAYAKSGEDAGSAFVEVTGPSRIFNANQAGAMRSGGGDGATAAELREFRREMESNATYMAQLTKAVADGIDTLVKPAFLCPC